MMLIAISNANCNHGWLTTLSDHDWYRDSQRDHMYDYDTFFFIMINHDVDRDMRLLSRHVITILLFDNVSVGAVALCARPGPAFLFKLLENSSA